jgi:tRNA threonylcarbamoyladenosine biosynthesis protein TsaB
MIICLETATNICSVALCDNAGVISLRENSDLKSHASKLTVFIEEILKEYHIRAADLDAIAVSKGPGSYTGLRIGVSVAKGIAYAASIPLIGIDTTLSMFWGMYGTQKNTPDNKVTYLYCPMLDARRMEIYYALYDGNGNIVKEVSAEIIDENSFSKIPVSQKIIFFGDGATKCMEIIKRDNIFFVDDFKISASYMHIPVYRALNARDYEDIAYFVPFYLKDFIATKPRKNIV